VHARPPVWARLVWAPFFWARPLALAIALAGAAAAQQRPAAALTPVLETFDFAGVTIDDGLLRRCLDETREFYLRIPDDDLLRPFRLRKGLPAPGAVLGGWYGNDVFHPFGQIVSGLARLGAATRDAACGSKVRALVHGFGECIDDDGWFFASRHPNAPHYIFDKLVGGLLDAHVYCGDPRALALLARIVGWAEQHLDRGRRRADTGTEWYTLGENLDRAFLLTGARRYREFAAVWAYDDWWQRLAAHQDPFTDAPTNGYHAYSHLNTIGSEAAAAEATGDRRLLDGAIAAHDWFVATQTFATGGFGPDEQLLPPAALRERLSLTNHSAETQCGAWAVFKLCKRLLRLTGDARHGDWIERQYLNAIAASIPPAPDGRVFYYSDYCTTGATKFLHDEPWTCCAGTRPQAVAELADLVWLRNGDALYVDLFVPSTLRCTVRGTGVVVALQTAFPAGDTVALEVAPEKPVRFPLRVRAPGWLSAPIAATLNGAALAADVDAHGWLALDRTWQPHDRVELRLPMALRAVPLPGGAPFPAAIALGPVVLAVRTTGRSPHGAIDLAHLAEVLVRSDDEALTYRVRGEPDLLLRPFHAIPQAEPYFVYLDPALQHRIAHRDVAFAGRWRDAGRFRFSNEKDATAEVAFEGTGIRWLGWAFDDAGIAEVAIDGAVVARVDQYGPGRDLPFDWRHRGLAKGRHVLRLRLLGEHAAGSKGCYLNVAGFEVDPDE
jgi:hypothetical protein